MNRIFIMLSFILIIFLIYGQMVFADYTYQWSDRINYYFNQDYVFDQYRLTDYELYLPEEDIRSFSLESQQELFDLATLYGKKKTNKTYSELITRINLPETNYPDVSLDLDSNNLDNKNNNSIELTPLPGILVNADFKQSDEDLELRTNANVNLQYQMNKRTLIRAEYVFTNKEWWDVKEINLEEKTDNPEVINNSDSQDSSNDEEDKSNNCDNLFTDDEDGLLVDKKLKSIFNEEKSEKSRVGISYQTSDKLTISADYIDDGFIDDLDFSTIWGVEYNDNQNRVRYQYQIDHDGKQAKQTVTGLEFGLKDFATFSASYKLLNPDLIKNRLKESSWDFDLDFNLSEISSLSIGLELKNNDYLNKEIDFKDDELKESNIEAMLKFKF